MKVHKSISDFDKRNTVVTIGVFDGVHQGHLSVLSRVIEIAKREKQETVIFTFWPHPRMVFQPENNDLKLLNSITEKIELLEKAGIDNLILFPFTKEFSKLSSCEFISDILVKKLHVANLVVGYNHHFGHNREGTYEDLVQCAKENNFHIERMEPYLVGNIDISSTLIRDALLNGNLEVANNYLGYSYFLTGKIVGGSKIGRSIGFPTANINPESKYKLIPKDGVYAVFVDYNGIQYKGMLNIGLRPTIDETELKKTIEVHIIDFDEWIYDKDITIRFVKRIRNEEKFKNIESLKIQLQKDRINIIRALKNI